MKRQARPKGNRVLPAKLKAASGLKRRVTAQTVEFAVIGDSHVGYGNSLSLFSSLLPKAVSSGNKRFVIFGGDNAQAGANHGNNANTYYKDFKDTVTSVLGTIPYKASIGNWEASTRSLFTQYLGAVSGQMDFPGTQGKVKYVWLDCALGTFSPASITLLRNLDDRYFYIIDFHWPLRVQGITVDSSHVLSAAETSRFFSSIPAKARDHVLAIFTHHAHKFYRKLSNIYPGYPKTKFFVCGCSGDYKCKPNGDRGYYNATLTSSGSGYKVDAYAAH